MTDWAEIGRQSGVSLVPGSAARQSGGSISSAFQVESGDGPLFLKLEPVANLDRLRAEADGLAALAATATVRVPRVLGTGTAGEEAFLLIEWIRRGGGRDAAAKLGEQLAALHAARSEQFGWHRDNYIGATPQPNTRSDSWVAFLRDCRLGYQFSLAAKKGYRFDSMTTERLLAGLAHFYADYRPVPSLLHGDLWGGNWLTDDTGQPVIFDPAVYVGDREADLAMTELFGGFGTAFYRAYNASWPLDPGYRVRRDLHKLYHVLNHLNLFGGGYHGQAQSLAKGLCAQLG